MDNKIRVHPEQLERMLQDPFWKKLYEADPNRFIVYDLPPKEKDDG